MRLLSEEVRATLLNTGDVKTRGPSPGDPTPRTYYPLRIYIIEGADQHDESSVVSELFVLVAMRRLSPTQEPLSVIYSVSLQFDGMPDCLVEFVDLDQPLDAIRETALAHLCEHIAVDLGRFWKEIHLKLWNELRPVRA